MLGHPGAWDENAFFGARSLGLNRFPTLEFVQNGLGVPIPPPLVQGFVARRWGARNIPRLGFGAGFLRFAGAFGHSRNLSRRGAKRETFFRPSEISASRDPPGPSCDGNYKNGKEYAFYAGMDPILEYQRGLLLTVFVSWGIAISLAAVLPFLVRNAEAWKTRLARALFSEPAVSFGEQALLALDFSPCCPNCHRPILGRKTGHGRNAVLICSCPVYPRSHGTQIAHRAA